MFDKIKEILQYITTESDNKTYSLAPILALGLIPFSCLMTLYDVAWRGHAWSVTDFGQGEGLVLVAVAAGFKIMQDKPKG